MEKKIREIEFNENFTIFFLRRDKILEVKKIEI